MDTDRVLLHLGKRKEFLSNTQIREALAKVSVTDASIPKFNPSAPITVGVSYADGRELLRSGNKIPFPHGDLPVTLSPLYESLFVQVLVADPNAQLSFIDADSLWNLLRYSSRVILVRRESPTCWNLYFSKAEALRRFVESPPPFIKDFPCVNLNVKHDLSSLGRYGFKAARLLGVYPVIYDYACSKKPFVLGARKIKEKVREEIGSQLLYHVHPYPRINKQRGILFFRDPRDAVVFMRRGYQRDHFGLMSVDCVFNAAYKKDRVFCSFTEEL